MVWCLYGSSGGGGGVGSGDVCRVMVVVVVWCM